MHAPTSWPVPSEIYEPGVHAGAAGRCTPGRRAKRSRGCRQSVACEDARLPRRPSTRLPRSPPWASVPLQETPDLSWLTPDLSTEVGDLRWKGKAMVGFSARKEIGGGEDGGGDRGYGAASPRTSPSREQMGEVGGVGYFTGCGT